MEFPKAPLFGMVYDFDNQPCSGARIVLDDEEGPQTDINGRFIIGSLSSGEYKIQVKKEGYEELTANFKFSNKNQVLYLRIISFNQLLRKAEYALEKKRLKETGELIQRVEAIDADDPVAMYLKALYLLECRKPEEAVKILNKILAKGYSEPVVYITLADIYQYRIDNAGKALFYLEESLKMQRNYKIEKRLEALKLELEEE
jgi:predicted Zn-dependent protease